MSSASRSTAATSNQMSSATISDIRSRIYSGGKMYYSDINAIMLALQAYSAHSHGYFDQISEYNYGNKSSGSSSGNYTTDTAPGTNYGQGANGKAYASDVNFMNGYARAFQNHYHTYTDH